VREHSSRTVGGFIEKGDFLRFRELALTFNAPETWAGRLFRGRSLSATASVRNIHVWTDYMGVDPEATGSATGNAPSEFQAFGPPTFIALRLNLGF
jgi:TonB-dependent starch-binding outer membrane protein SusC